MEFWSVEVKAGEPVTAEPEDNAIIHLSHVSLGEVKKDKGNELVNIFAKIGDKKVVLGTLSTQNNQQITYDLVFDEEVELSHNWKNGSVYFLGYQSELPGQGFDPEDFSDDDLPMDLVNAEDVKASGAAKPESKPKPKSVQIKEAKPEESDEDDSDDDDDDDSDESDDGSDGEGMSVDEDSDDDESDEENSDSEEETPKKAAKGNKRPNESATKTPVPAKKQKQATPQKTDGKKGGHTATPHPAKGAANGTNTKGQTPKSGGKFTCGSCEKPFGSEAALQSHSKAKHGK